MNGILGFIVLLPLLLCVLEIFHKKVLKNIKKKKRTSYLIVLTQAVAESSQEVSLGNLQNYLLVCFPSEFEVVPPPFTV